MPQENKINLSIIIPVFNEKTFLIKLFEEINAAKRFNESIMGSIATSVITINLLGEVDSVNKAGVGLLSKKTNEIVGEHYSYLFSKDQNLCKAIESAEIELESFAELNVPLMSKSIA